MLVCQRRPDLSNYWKLGVDDRAVRSSCGSDMSIDDPTEDPSGPYTRAHHQVQNMYEQQPEPSQALQDQSRSATCQQPKSLPITTFPSRRNVNEKNEANKEESHEASEKEQKEDVQTESLFSSSSSSSSPAAQSTRRLSVQDRINLFENKQKEISTAGSGGKPVAVNKSVELRRLSSDVSSATLPEKAVLRRWSGASDMSIDVSGEKKDSESPLCTPSSASSVSQANKASNIALEDKDQKGLNDSATSSAKIEARSGSARDGNDGGLKDQVEGLSRIGVSSGQEELGSNQRNNWKEQAVSQTQFKSSPRAEQVGLSDRGVSQEKSKISSNSEERSRGFKDQADSTTISRGFPGRIEIFGSKNQAGLQKQIGGFENKAGDVSSDGGSVNKLEDSGLTDNPMVQSWRKSFHNHTRSLSGQFDGGIGLKLKDASSAQLKGVQGDELPPQPQRGTLTGEVEERSRVDLASSDKQQLKVEDSGGRKVKFQKQVHANHEQLRSRGRRDETNIAYENSKFDFSVKNVSANQEISDKSTPPIEQIQRVRQSKGNQELNNELKLKANELEKLFAEHKLRVPGDQSGSARRNKPADVQVEQAVTSQYRKPAAEEISPAQLPEKSTVIEPTSGSSNIAKFTTPPAKKVDNQEYCDTRRQNFSDLGFSDDSRGKFYEKYMQKRDAKLREEWGSRGAEKEAKLKSLQDSLEHSRAELKSKFSGLADSQDSLSSARRRAEKLRSFNLLSITKIEQVLFVPVLSLATTTKT